MLDDIDYGDLSVSAEPAPKKKSAISERKLSSKSESKPIPKPVDTGVLADRATALQEGLGAPEIGDPLAQYGLPGLGVLGGLATAYGLYQASKNKPAASVTPPSVVGGIPAASSVQYTTAGSQPTMQYGKQTMNAPVGVPAPADIPPASPSIDEQIKMEKLKQAQLRTAALEKAFQPKPAGTPVAAADTVANVAPEALKPPPTVADLEARVQAGREAGLGLKRSEVPAVTQLAEQPITSPTLGEAVTPKTRAPKTQKTFKSVAEIPEGMKFSSEVGGADSWLHDAVGPEARKFILEEFNQGKRLGGGKEAMTKAYGLVGQYEDWLKKNVPENILGRSERKAAGVPHPQQSGPLGKAAKVGGMAGLLMTAAQFANAKTPEEKMNAGTNLLGAILPPGADILEAGAPTVNDKQFQNAYKLGSPYAQTEEAKKARLKEKAGAGRGIAPPSAYQR